MLSSNSGGDFRPCNFNTAVKMSYLQLAYLVGPIVNVECDFTDLQINSLLHTFPIDIIS